jgi:molybdate transport system substrate-binding protein
MSYVVGLSSLPVFLGNCSKSAAEHEPAPAATASVNAERELTVFAAASLRDVFGEIANAFKASRPGTRVTFSFAGSQDLATQIQHGASVDVFAAADVGPIDRLSGAGLTSAGDIFACNEPVVVVPTKNPAAVLTFADLPKARRLVIGAAAVPIGKYSEQILQNANSLTPDFAQSVMSNVVSREMNVRQVLTKVALGEADAGIVYRTDTLGATQVTVIEIPAAVNVRAKYPIAAVLKSKYPELAADWKAFVLTGEGHSLLVMAGFGCPN